MEQDTGASTPPPTQRAGINPYLIPLAIVVAGFAIAAALYYSRAGGSGAAAPTRAGNAVSIRAVNERDHVYGSRDADVFLIEYSDFQCPYCERFHKTVTELVAQYEGRVAWVYRHFPLDSIHPEARPAAVASECAAELGGADAFWRFSDALFAAQRSLGEELYVRAAGDLGIDADAFRACLRGGSYDALIDGDLEESSAAGANGTPFNVLMTKGGQTFTFSGALPIATVKPLVDRALRAADAE